MKQPRSVRVVETLINLTSIGIAVLVAILIFNPILLAVIWAFITKGIPL